MVVGGGDGGVRVWEIGWGSAKLVKTVREHRGKVTSADISQDGKLVMTTGSDGAGIVWNLSTLTRNQLLKGTSGLRCGFLHPNNLHGLILGVDNSLGYWDLMGGGELRNMMLTR